SMPDMDGITFLKRIRELYDDIPFIFCTTRTSEEVLIQAIFYHVDYYVLKNENPELTFDELIHTIRQAAERRRPERKTLKSEELVQDIRGSKLIEENCLECKERFRGMAERVSDIMMVNAAADIERSCIEQKLREHQQMLAEAMDLAHLVTWEYDAIADIFTFNDRFYAMYGTTAEQEGGYQMSSERYAREFLHPDDLYMVAEEVQKALTASDPDFISQREHRIIRRDGEIRFIVVRFGITKDENGRTIRTHGANQDITELKKNEMALKQANRQLSLLTSITRHDILNMVAVQLLYLDRLQDLCRDPELCEVYGKISSATTKIQSQIEFTKVYEDIGLQEPVWQKTGDLLARLDVPSGISFENLLPDISVCADPMLEKVFYTLLDNSVRHGQLVTTIRVSSYLDEAAMVIVWEDNGVGIPADEKEKVFERGFGKNTGLGMFLAREILFLTGIEIHEMGEYGVGVRFEIRIPKGGWRYP
ncbi:HAMP domain-containing sensor histidine kinase, partial [Methanospirillum hungatei]|uniref:sensor histidine kinase n=1 Tax=Methanospirillum hungatei TaxID=2203 RepID=UPI0026EA43A9